MQNVAMPLDETLTRPARPAPGNPAFDRRSGENAARNHCRRHTFIHQGSIVSPRQTRALRLEIKESFVMSKQLVSLALAAVLTAGTMVPAADAGKRGHHYRGDHHGKHHGRHHRRHHGRGYYKDGKWIALGILGAAVGAAIADRDCYYRRGRRYCDY
jgi:hypothetical protein